MAIERVLMTGAGGFLGQAIVRELLPRLESGDDPLREIRALDLDVTRLPTHEGIVPLTGSITDAELVARACDGVDAVLHCASLVDWGNVSDETLREVNVGGTALLLDAAAAAGVRSFVYTSSMDVACGSDPVVDVTEEVPIPDHLENIYCETKAEAEVLVLAANGRERGRRAGEPPGGEAAMRTAALRPCGMYGEADPYHVKNTLDVVRGGKLAARPGDGTALFEHVYVGNVAHAHVVALDRLDAGDDAASGEAFFVTDDTPALNFLEFMEPIVESLGLTLPPRSRRVPYPVMWLAAVFAELTGLVGRPFGMKPPVLTRSSVRFVCKTHTFDGSKARRVLGYAPRFSYDEAMARTIAWWQEQERTLGSEARGGDRARAERDASAA